MLQATKRNIFMNNNFYHIQNLFVKWYYNVKYKGFQF